jgi:hypothetical protein
MDKVFDELAELVGKILARRWLNRNAAPRHPSDAEIDAHAGRGAAISGIPVEASGRMAKEPPQDS